MNDPVNFISMESCRYFKYITLWLSVFTNFKQFKTHFKQFCDNPFSNYIFN